MPSIGKQIHGLDDVTHSYNKDAIKFDMGVERYYWLVTKKLM
jgi:hypothetical protein